MTKPMNLPVRPAKTDQPGHPLSLIRAFAVHMKKPWVLSYLLSAQEDSDQTGRISKLIWVFAVRTGQFVGFVMLRLILWFYIFLPFLFLQEESWDLWLWHSLEIVSLYFIDEENYNNICIWAPKYD